jgi:hypothetical protein
MSMVTPVTQEAHRPFVKPLGDDAGSGEREGEVIDHLLSRIIEGRR